MGEVTQNFQRLQAAIAEAAPGREILFVGAAKDQPVERVREAIHAGLKIVAMNYAQQGDVLRDALGADAARVEWHFIGHIQSRKAKLLGRYDCIQSLDRLEIASILSERRGEESKGPSVLVEINIGDEPQKSGISAEHLATFLEELSALPHLRVAGLMGMPPPLEPVEARRPYFRRLKELFDTYQSRYSFTQLSMGTSEDFLVAVEEGATMVRVGTSLFGNRERK